MNANLDFFKHFQVLAEEAEAPMPSEWTIDLVNATVALWDDSAPEEADADRLQFVCQALFTLMSTLNFTFRGHANIILNLKLPL